MPVTILDEKEADKAAEAEADKKAKKASRDTDRLIQASVQKKLLSDRLLKTDKVSWLSKKEKLEGKIADPHDWLTWVKWACYGPGRLRLDPNQIALWSYWLADYERAQREGTKYLAELRAADLKTVGAQLEMMGILPEDVGPEVVYPAPEIFGQKSKVLPSSQLRED